MTPTNQPTNAELCSSNALFDLDFPSSLRFLSARASLLCLSNCSWMLSNVSCSFIVFNSDSKPAKIKISIIHVILTSNWQFVQTIMTKCQLILFQLACFSSTKNTHPCNTSTLLEWPKCHSQQNKHFIFLMFVMWFTPTSKNPINFLPEQKKPGKSGTFILQCKPPDTAYSEIRYRLQKKNSIFWYILYRKDQETTTKDGHYDKM